MRIVGWLTCAGFLLLGCLLFCAGFLHALFPGLAFGLALTAIQLQQSKVFSLCSLVQSKVLKSICARGPFGLSTCQRDFSCEDEDDEELSCALGHCMPQWFSH